MVQHCIDSLALMGRDHTEEENSRPPDTLHLEGPEQPKNHGEQAPRAVGAEDHVEIGKRYPETNELSILLRHRHQLGDHHWLELLGEVVDLLAGHWHEAQFFSHAALYNA